MKSEKLKKKKENKKCQLEHLSLFFKITTLLNAYHDLNLAGSSANLRRKLFDVTTFPSLMPCNFYSFVVSPSRYQLVQLIKID